jgi:hypothetical protein
LDLVTSVKIILKIVDRFFKRKTWPRVLLIEFIMFSMFVHRKFDRQKWSTYKIDRNGSLDESFFIWSLNEWGSNLSIDLTDRVIYIWPVIVSWLLPRNRLIGRIFSTKVYIGENDHLIKWIIRQINFIQWSFERLG